MGYHYFEPCSGIKKYLQVTLNFINLSRKEKRVVLGLVLNQILTLNLDLTICVPLSHTCSYRAI